MAGEGRGPRDRTSPSSPGHWPPACPAPERPRHLNLLEGDLEAEGLVEVGVQRLLFHGRLFLLEPLAVLHQVDLHVGVCAGRAGPRPSAPPQGEPAPGTSAPPTGPAPPSRPGSRHPRPLLRPETQSEHPIQGHRKFPRGPPLPTPHPRPRPGQSRIAGAWTTRGPSRLPCEENLKSHTPGGSSEPSRGPQRKGGSGGPDPLLQGPAGDSAAAAWVPGPRLRPGLAHWCHPVAARSPAGT